MTKVTPGDYEKLIRVIMEGVADKWKIDISQIDNGRPNRVPGASGFSHQIDVSARYTSEDGEKRFWLCECKLRKERKICPLDILTFIARIFDIQKYEGDNVKVEGNFFKQISGTLLELYNLLHFTVSDID